MKLVVVHYHLRPGGVRRVIELALPALVRALRPAVSEVVLAVGEAGDTRWLAALQATLAPRPVTLCVQPELAYWTETSQSAAVTRRLRVFFDTLLGETGTETLVWAHNPGLGRNLPATAALVRACVRHRRSLVLHHHDWWFDNRWHRWAELRAAGGSTLSRVAATILPGAANVRHVAINGADAACLRRHFPQQGGWLPNPSSPARRPVPKRVRTALDWLRVTLGDEAPVWLLPCRLLRRKNVAEALLLTRWLRPEAWLVTTAAVSSPDEQSYAERLAADAQRHGWRLRLSVLQGEHRERPTVAELMAASEALILTSLVEGFGLPYLEAATARRPLLARALPNIAPDLKQFGFRFPYAYDEVLIAPSLFDWPAEHARQQEQFWRWRSRLPSACRHWAQPPAWLAQQDVTAPVSFSRLTLTAQLEVLAQPSAGSWKQCAPLNPFLEKCRSAAAAGRLQPMSWPRSAEKWLSGPAYARQFNAILRDRPKCEPGRGASLAAQEDFMRSKLTAENQYPLLWGDDS
ncbi:MAG: hypothetical protein HZA31_03020 [Opitutae bacterium]|nr:hypothetical protein [Opitutae bacterium]